MNISTYIHIWVRLFNSHWLVLLKMFCHESGKFYFGIYQKYKWSISNIYPNISKSIIVYFCIEHVSRYMYMCLYICMYTSEVGGMSPTGKSFRFVSFVRTCVRPAMWHGSFDFDLFIDRIGRCMYCSAHIYIYIYIYIYMCVDVYI